MLRHFVDDDGHSIFLANLSALTLTLPQLGVTTWFKSGEVQRSRADSTFTSSAMRS
jgi:hypothetical protein